MSARQFVQLVRVASTIVAPLLPVVTSVSTSPGFILQLVDLAILEDEGGIGAMLSLVLVLSLDLIAMSVRRRARSLPLERRTRR